MVAGVAAALAAEHAHGIARGLARDVVPAFDGGEAEAHGLLGDRMAPGLRGQGAQGGDQLAAAGRRSQQRADDGEPQSGPPVVTGGPGVVVHPHSLLPATPSAPPVRSRTSLGARRGRHQSHRLRVVSGHRQARAEAHAAGGQGTQKPQQAQRAGRARPGPGSDPGARRARRRPARAE